MTVRIAVIGTGAIGRDHARRINQVLAGGKIVALSDVNRASAASAKANIALYDVELQDFLRAAALKSATGPSSWDGYMAAITSDACVAAQEKEGEAVAINLPVRPALYV